jgi:OmpA-OmpF porin, OOP family
MRKSTIFLLLLVSILNTTISLGQSIDTAKRGLPIDLPSITFKGQSTALSKDAKTALTFVADYLKQHPEWLLVVKAFGFSTKLSQQRCFRKIDSIKRYLIEQQGISADRIVGTCDLSNAGDESTVDLQTRDR